MAFIYREATQLFGSPEESGLSDSDAAAAHSHRHHRFAGCSKYPRAADRHQGGSAEHKSKKTDPCVVEELLIQFNFLPSLAAIYSRYNITLQARSARCNARGLYHYIFGRYVGGWALYDAVHAQCSTTTTQDVLDAADI